MGDEGKCGRDEGNLESAGDVRTAGCGRKLRGKGGHGMRKFREDVGSERIVGLGNIVDGEIAG